MSLLLNLGAVDGNERSRVWHQTIKDNYLDLDIKLKSARQPSGMIARAQAGPITFSALSSVAQSHERSASLIDDDVDHLIGWLQFRGRAHVDHYGRETDLAPGSFVLVDCGEPYKVDFLDDDYQIFAIKIPRLFFKGAFVSKKDFVNVRVDERHGSLVVVDHFRRLARSFDAIATEQRALWSALGVQLIVDAATAQHSNAA